jgi:hypothetical protein
MKVVRQSGRNTPRKYGRPRFLAVLVQLLHKIKGSAAEESTQLTSCSLTCSLGPLGTEPGRSRRRPGTTEPVTSTAEAHLLKEEWGSNLTQGEDGDRNRTGGLISHAVKQELGRIAE